MVTLILALEICCLWGGCLAQPLAMLAILRSLGLGGLPVSDVLMLDPLGMPDVWRRLCLWLTHQLYLRLVSLSVTLGPLRGRTWKWSLGLSHEIFSLWFSAECSVL